MKEAKRLNELERDHDFMKQLGSLYPVRKLILCMEQENEISLDEIMEKGEESLVIRKDHRFKQGELQRQRTFCAFLRKATEIAGKHI